MKIEIGESLILSWLRHVKECQLAQTNWKASSQWETENKSTLQALMASSAALFRDKYGYDLYKGTTSLEQLLMQAEIDMIGIHTADNVNDIYAIDVAFHEAGLNYGPRPETVARAIKKYIRTAMCLHGYFGAKKGTIVFASPKVTPAVYNDINACIEDITQVLQNEGLQFSVRFIANQDFAAKILNPVLQSVENVADTAELFVRSIQMFNLFLRQQGPRSQAAGHSSKMGQKIEVSGQTDFGEMKIGAIARTLLRHSLETYAFSDEEISCLQDKNYSKDTFGLQFPLLRKTESASAPKIERYYAKPVEINGAFYFICSEWYDKSRPMLLTWIDLHNKK